MDFADKVVWITGATSGIGEAMAYELARQGARLILSARRETQLHAVRQRCLHSDRHQIMPMDMADSAAIPVKVMQVLAVCGHVDVLINNAGISQRSKVKDTSLEVDRQLMEVDFFGPVALTKALLPSMLERGEGLMVAVSSVAGLVATPLRSSYCAAKHALAAFYDALRAEVHDSGVRVAVIYPGFVRTEITLHALEGDGSAHGVLDPKLKTGMSADVFAAQAVAALSRGDERIILAGNEKWAVWLGRASPSLLATVIRKAKVT
ncbi:MAG: SDR family oxidoreductase [Pseudomonadales bacterium]|nr:SDR family oxidoreductase [Pseudomonadales bacterium]